MKRAPAPKGKRSLYYYLAEPLPTLQNFTHRMLTHCSLSAVTLSIRADTNVSLKYVAGFRIQFNSVHLLSIIN